MLVLLTGVCLALLRALRLLPGYRRIEDQRFIGRRVPIYEPNLTELLAEAGPNLHFTTSYCEAIPGAEVVFIAVGTPPTPSGAPNLEYLSQAARSIGQHINSEFTVVVNKSTVPIGSGNWVGPPCCAKPVNSTIPVSARPSLLSPPTRNSCARVQPCNDSLYPDRIVIGADETAGAWRYSTPYIGPLWTKPSPRPLTCRGRSRFLRYRCFPPTSLPPN